MIRPILLAADSVNQSAPSGPAAMPPGLLPKVGIANSVITPAGVIRPIRFPPGSVNQRLPSAPVVIPWAALTELNSVVLPAVVVRPIPLLEVNQRLPSGPVVDFLEAQQAETSNDRDHTIRGDPADLPIRPTCSVNQRLPSGPAVMLRGLLEPTEEIG